MSIHGYVQTVSYRAIRQLFRIGDSVRSGSRRPAQKSGLEKPRGGAATLPTGRNGPKPPTPKRVPGCGHSWVANRPGSPPLPLPTRRRGPRGPWSRAKNVTEPLQSLELTQTAAATGCHSRMQG